MEDDEFSVRERPCLVCGRPLGRHSLQPRSGIWVHRDCDKLMRSTIETLGRYVDILNGERI